MAWRLKPALLAFCGIVSALPLGAQQSGLSASFLTPAATRVSAPASRPSISETEKLSYLNQLAKNAHDAKSGTFKPNASDLLVDRAEDRFRAGRKAYSEGDFDRARSEFDAAIDAMLRGSDNPTDRALFECRLDDMVDAIHRCDLDGLGGAADQSTPQFDKAPLEDIVQMTFPVDPRIKEKVQTELKNTSSALPLVMNDVVLGYVNYFNGRGRKTIEFGLSRAAKYQPMISKILAEEGVPQELIHLAQAESGFMPRAVSRAAAQGMWQFVKFRGNEYGLTQTPTSDLRFDPEKATRAAAHHLHDLYNEFHDWYLAIAAYNCGPGTVEKAVERTGYADYWELRSRGALPAETTNYVPIILAMTIMSKNASEYGLQIHPEAVIEYDTIHTVAPINLALLSDLTDVSVPELQQLNPALLRNTAPADFDVRVPKGLGPQVAANLDALPATALASARLHTVESGETLALIAKRFNAPPKAISVANSIEGAEPAVGTKIVIPGAYKEPVIIARKAPVKGKPGASASKTLVARRSSGSRSASTSKAPVKSATTASKTPNSKTATTAAKAPSKTAGPKTAGTIARK